MHEPMNETEKKMTEGQVFLVKTTLSGIITSANDALAHMTGYRNGELIGKPLSLLQHPDTPEAVSQSCRETLASGEPWSGTFRIQGKKGAFAWAQANATALTDHGRVSGHLYVFNRASIEEIDQAESTVRSKMTWRTRLNILARLKISHRMVLNVLLLSILALTTSGIYHMALGEAEDAIAMSINDRAVAQDIEQIAELSGSIFSIVAGGIASQDDNLWARMGKELDQAVSTIQGTMVKMRKADLSATEREAMEVYFVAIEQYLSGFAKTIQSYLTHQNKPGIQALLGQYHDHYAPLIMARKTTLTQIQQKQTDIEAKTMHASIVFTRELATGILLIGILIASLLAYATITNISRRLKGTHDRVKAIIDGKYFDWITVNQNDEISRLLKGLKSMQIKLGTEVVEGQERAMAAERIRQALDRVSANVMVADADYNIIYTNDAVQTMFSDIESELRASGINGFNASDMVGSNMDIFHKDPSHQRRMLDGLSQRITVNIQQGELHLRAHFSPVFDAQGTRAGTAVEWINRTQEVMIEDEIKRTVGAAARGDFSHRIDSRDMEGFFQNTANMLNQLSDIAEEGLSETVRVIHGLSEGDLTQSIDKDYEGIFADLKSNCNATSGKLQDIVTNIRSAAVEVNRGATEISEGNVSLSTRTEQQASNLEETAAAMEEMTSTVKQNADNARQASQLANAARDAAETGGTVVTQAVAAVKDISDASRKIADIISVIDEIAFQTNLLALNASVEAARAGEQGRGFAVVASEVRNLAGRSATAAREIKDLIEDSVNKVDDGARLVSESGESLKEIVLSVKKVTDIVSEIAAASSEQTEGIDQINKAITQVDEMTQRNAALVEEATAASQALRQEASQLDTMMGFFNTGTPSATAGHAYAPPPTGQPIGYQAGQVRTEDRRAAQRPWSADGKAGTQPAATSAPVRKQAAGGAAEDVWEEF